MVKIWLDLNFAEAHLNTSLFINIKFSLLFIYYLIIYERDCHMLNLQWNIFYQKSFCLFFVSSADEGLKKKLNGVAALIVVV